MKQYADIIYVNGRVLTIDENSTVAEGLAIAGDEILAVGERHEIERLAGPDTRVVDMRGGTLLPGINDSHLHAISWGLTRPPLSLDVSYPAVTSIADITRVVADAVAQAEPGQWIVGAGWDLGYLEECRENPDRMPTRHDLDAVSPDNPVHLQDFSYHTIWVNSRALELAGIDENTVPPPGSTILTDDGGRPTGVLSEGAQHAIAALLPPLDDEVREAAVLSAVAELNALGITSFTEPGLGPGDKSGGMGEGGLATYHRLLEEGRLNARVTALLLPVSMSSSYADFAAELDAMTVPPAKDPRMVNVVGVKILADGIPPNKTAWMHDHYVSGGCGELTVAGETDEERVAQLNQMIAHAHRAGYQAGVHITGDRGIDAVVDAFAAAVNEHPRQDSRHYVIHGDFLTARSMRICAEYGFGVNMNPTIKWTIADLEEQFVGAERAAYEWPYRDAIDAGINVASGSDAPVTAPDWLQGVSTMMLRESKASGKVSGADQCITLTEALRTYTAAGAWQDFAEDWKGTLEPGKVADLCLLDQDLLSLDPHDIPRATVRMTVLGGRVIHERES
ncbi:amidohydrolase [Nonomuraea angiospora]|uniref:Amidohydrolase YtcJ n=1 Tax=Nonomuraea angiospora TaxID=46172 RepID=A0ABR9LQ09_9ACTN|nr:amidohydrolase [Nonomuraea angiospora]MBE1582736.1 putative amidohydrolase YtcJ [Nonomuraea angiospora]